VVKIITIVLYKFLYKIGSFTRNSSIKKHLIFLEKSNGWSSNKLKDYQLQKLKEIVAFAYENSSFYKLHFSSNNFHPSDIKNLTDVNKIPILEKTDLLNSNKEVHTNFKGKTFTAVTSGSSGQSLRFQRDESADSFNRAVFQKSYLWYGVYPWELNGYFWGFNFNFLKKNKTIFLDFLQNRFRLFSYDSINLIKFVKKLNKATYIHGYSSMIYQTAKLINERGLLKPNGIKMVKGTSEKIFKNYQDEVIKAFGSKIVSEYGATESGIIAFECPEGNMHINMEGVLVEEIDDEIVVTNLQMKSFPIIRYRLGDYIELESEKIKCKCGRNHRILKEVTGRVGSPIHGKSEIYPSFTFYYIFKNLDLQYGLSLNYQIIQKEKGILIVRIEQKLTNKNIKKIDIEFKKYFNKDINYTIKDEYILQSNKGKLKSFISHLDYD
jgi:phenylacetate-CoA ligase